MIQRAVQSSCIVGRVDLQLPSPYGPLVLHTLQRGVGQPGYKEPMVVLKEVHRKLPHLSSMSMSTLTSHLLRGPGPLGHTEGDVCPSEKWE